MDIPDDTDRKFDSLQVRVHEVMDHFGVDRKKDVDFTASIAWALGMEIEFHLRPKDPAVQLVANPAGDPVMVVEQMDQSWQRYAADFDAMTDKQIENETDRARSLVEEQEDWLEAVAAWQAAGSPRTAGAEGR